MHHLEEFQSLWAQLRSEVKKLRNKGYFGDGERVSDPCVHCWIACRFLVGWRSLGRWCLDGPRDIRWNGLSRIYGKQKASTFKFVLTVYRSAEEHSRDRDQMSWGNGEGVHPERAHQITLVLKLKESARLDPG